MVKENTSVLRLLDDTYLLVLFCYILGGLG